MKIEEAIRRIGEGGVIPVVRASSGDEATRAVAAICEGGISIIEITMTVPDAPAILRAVRREYGEKVLTGAGTVTTAREAEACIEAGAQFLVSPGLSREVMRTAAARGVLAVPGTLTPTEVMAAVEAGGEVLKVFPCGNVGGPKYLKSLRAPFPRVRFVPTGGVNLSNAAEYIGAGAFALGVGADLVDLNALRNQQAGKISDAARALMEAVRMARDKRAERRQELEEQGVDPARV